jgi:hypothetical protein
MTVTMQHKSSSEMRKSKFHEIWKVHELDYNPTKPTQINRSNQRTKEY